MCECCFLPRRICSIIKPGLWRRCEWETTFNIFSFSSQGPARCIGCFCSAWLCSGASLSISVRTDRNRRRRCVDGNGRRVCTINVYKFGSGYLIHAHARSLAQSALISGDRVRVSDDMHSPGTLGRAHPTTISRTWNVRSVWGGSRVDDSDKTLSARLLRTLSARYGIFIVYTCALWLASQASPRIELGCLGWSLAPMRTSWQPRVDRFSIPNCKIDLFTLYFKMFDINNIILYDILFCIRYTFSIKTSLILLFDVPQVDRPIMTWKRSANSEVKTQDKRCRELLRVNKCMQRDLCGTYKIKENNVLPYYSIYCEHFRRIWQ